MNEGALIIPVIYHFVFNVLIGLYRLMGENLGLSLITIAVISRLLTLPLTAKQIKNASKTKEFQSKYKEVKEKYKNDKDRQSRELAKLQGQYLPGQLAGCLPMILQLVVLIQINFVIRNLIKHNSEAFDAIAYGFMDKFNGTQISLDFLGGAINLGKSANEVGLTNFSKSWPYLIIAVILVVSQFFSMRLFSSFGKTKEDKKNQEKKEKDKKKDEAPGFGEIFSQTNSQMMLLFPVILGFFSLNYPSGLSLYFATTSLFVIIQQAFIRRKEIIKKVKKDHSAEDGKEKTSEIKNGVKEDEESEEKKKEKDEGLILQYPNGHKQAQDKKIKKLKKKKKKKRKKRKRK